MSEEGGKDEEGYKDEKNAAASKQPRPPDIKAVLSLFQDAIQMMPMEEKETYLQARVQCPDLVQEESDPVMFLEFEDFDIWRGVTRLLKYWKWRKDTFGERAFLRVIDLTGFGACDERMIKIMGKRAGFLLPHNNEGTYISFFDRRKLGKEFFNMDDRSALALAFFLFQDIISEHKKSKCKGKASYCALNLMSSIPPWFGSKKMWANLVKEAMPIELKWIRVLILPEENKDKTWFRAILPSLQLLLLKKLHFTKVEILSFDSKNDLKNKLVSLGLREDILPECIGGSYSIDKNWGFSRQFREKTVWHTRSLYMGDRDAETDPLQVQGAENGAIRNANHAYPLQNAINEIPYSEKLSLLKAQEYAPDLVKEESHQLIFHRFHELNAQNAAIHLCQYWQIRTNLFAGMTFLRMNQVGTGALDRHDIKVLRSCIFMILPRDKYGNVILVYDNTKISGYSFSSIRRCAFYMLYLLMEQATATASSELRIAGVRLLFRATDEKMKPTRIRQQFSDILQAFPLRFISFHLVFDSSKSSSSGIVQEAFLQLNNLFSPPRRSIFLHRPKPGEKVSDLVKDFGLDDDNLPDYFGGSWTEMSFIKWQDDIIHHEARIRSTAQVRTELKSLYFCKKEQEWKKLGKEEPDVTDPKRKPKRKRQRRL